MSAAPLFGAIENTTLAVVMTDAALDKLQCGIVARMAHDGFARAIDPVHTPRDGDCVFTMATGRRPGNVFQVGVAAADAVAASIRRAVRAAESLGGAVSVTDWRPGGQGGAARAAGGAAGLDERRHPLLRDHLRPACRTGRRPGARGIHRARADHGGAPRGASVAHPGGARTRTTWWWCPSS